MRPRAVGMGAQEGYSERRLVENEQLARRINRRIEDQVTAIREEADEDPDRPIMFFCECADPACRERVEATPDEYDRVHADPARFVVVSGHERPDIETIVDHLRMHPIVRKHALE